MRILQINGGVFGSTGKIMFGIARAAEKRGHKVMCAAPVTATNRTAQPENGYVRIGTYYSRCISVLLARITGFEGCFSFFETVALLRRVKRFSPDVIHIHSIHNSYLNLPLLFRYIKKNNIRTVWTLHDCWAFTGHCPHFEAEGCDKWKAQCGDCPRYRDYPKSFFDNSGKMYRLKKKWFTGVNNMTVVTPSEWLSELVGQSFLRDYPVKVINNGIDLSVFKPAEGDLRERYGLCDKKIVLGVSFGWDRKKGLDVFSALAERLPDEYRIVLVGTDDNVDKSLFDRVISIHRTADQQALAGIYTAADVFVNPTREDTLPTVNMEALACGTPVITFKTGGSGEIADSSCGSAVDKDDMEMLVDEIRRVCEKNPYSKESCLKRAGAFEMNERFSEYTDLYER
ncbi:MAG: glycosyltransferase [Clostridia bacterium]|nr:glycosyltransferase [Clostridia bacterium]